jgi:di/tricarboxylate transporter
MSALSGWTGGEPEVEMTSDIATCLVIVGVAVVLFAWDRIAAEIVALGVLVAIILTGLVSPQTAFSGFGSSTVIMMLGLLIMTAAMSHTGIVDMAGRAILDHVGSNPLVQIATIMIAVSFLSAFISNTAATAFFIPVVLGFAQTAKLNPSKFLLPVAFASILTSSVTLISTSTNIVISELLTKSGQRAMGMFELSAVGVPIAVAGLIYMMTIGVRLMPDRSHEPRLSEALGNRTYQADVVVPAESQMIGKTLTQTPLGKSAGLEVRRLLRDGKITDLSEALFQAEDQLLVVGERQDLLKIKDMNGFEIKADVHLADPDVAAEDLAIVEGVLMPSSPLIGRTLREAEFHDRYGLQVLGINRAGYSLPRKISRTRLQLGDVLLLQGKPDNVRQLERGNLFNIFGGVDTIRLKTSHSALAVGIFIAALLAATFDLLPLPVAAISGAFLMLLTRCIDPEEAYRRIEWKVLILIGSLLSLGAAMEATGTGNFLAAQLIRVIGDQHPLLMLSCFFGLTVALTQPMSNQAAAIVVVPIALATAAQLGLNPRSFAMMIAVAASCSYLTPLEPSSLMVYGPGKYRFLDFVKVGFPLTFLIFMIAIVLVPWVWPLAGP